MPRGALLQAEEMPQLRGACLSEAATRTHGWMAEGAWAGTRGGATLGGRLPFELACLLTRFGTAGLNKRDLSFGL